MIKKAISNVLLAAILASTSGGFTIASFADAIQFDGGRFIQGSSYRRVLGSVSLGNGNIAVCGATTSSDIATSGVAFENITEFSSGGNTVDAFVAIYNEQSMALVAATYLGGSNFDECYGIAVAPDGSIVVVGETRSNDFPTLSAFDSNFSGSRDGFVTSFSADLTAVNFSTYVGGSGQSLSEALYRVDIALDGTIHVVGTSNSTNLPVTEIFNNRACGTHDFSSVQNDLMYARFKSTGALQNLYCIGGNSGRSAGYDVVVGPQNKVYVAGRTDSGTFTYPNSVTDLTDPLAENRHLYLLEIDNVSGIVERAILVVDRLGGFPYITDMAFTDNGELLIAGAADAPGFTATANAIKTLPTETELSTPEEEDYFYAAFLMRLNQNVDNIEYATYFGGDTTDQVIRNISANSAEEVWGSLETIDRTLPTLNGPTVPPRPLSKEFVLAAESSGARVFGFKPAIFSSSSLFATLAQSGQNYKSNYSLGSSRLGSIEPADGIVADTRDIALDDRGFHQGVIVNYNDVNVAFESNSFGDTTFGASDDKSVRAALGGDTIFVANENQPNRIYSWVASPTITEVGTFGNNDDPIIDIEHSNANTFYVAEHPNRIITYTPAGDVVDEIQIDNVVISEIRYQRFLNALLITNSIGPSLLLRIPDGDLLSNATSITIDNTLTNIQSLVMASVGFDDLILAATDDAIHVYKLLVDENWAIEKTYQTPTTLTGSRFGEGRFGTAEDVLAIANLDGPAAYRHINAADFYIGTFNTVSGQQLSGSYFGGSGNDYCACAMTLMESGDIILSANTIAVDMTGFVDTDFTRAEKTALVRITQIDDMLDTDADGAPDFNDNCTNVANSSQIDSDADGYGNACDGDFNNDCSINFADIAAFSNKFLSADDLYDMNGDDIVNFIDFTLLTGSFLSPPGAGLGNCQ
ncbi:MAG: thrombospondin type 3 repeat-containing protein [Pseudomonadota bacterium]